MFADFNKIFQNKQDQNLLIPAVILQELNKPLINGLKYVDNGQGYCTLTSEGELTIGGLELIVDDKMRKYLGEVYSNEDIIDYSYNTQQKLCFRCKKDGYVQMNGQDISVDKLCFDPYKNIEFVEGEFFTMPTPFPGPFEVVLGDGEYEVKVSIQRIPCDKKNCINLSTLPNSPILLDIQINNCTHRMNCNLKLNLKKVSSVKEIVAVMSVFYALGIGKGLINNTNIKLVKDGNIDFNFDKIAIDFWKKVYDIERLTKSSFIVPEGEMGYEILRDVERLYQMLVFKNPIRSSDRLNSLSFAIEMKEGHSLDELKTGKGTFVFDSMHIYNLFGTKIVLPSIVFINDVIVADIKQEEDKNELVIDNDKLRAYYSELVFCDVESRDCYKEAHNWEKFIKAKTIDEYLMDKQVVTE